MARLTVHPDVRIHEESLHNVINVSKNSRVTPVVDSNLLDDM